MIYEFVLAFVEERLGTVTAPCVMYVFVCFQDDNISYLFTIVSWNDVVHVYTERS